MPYQQGSCGGRSENLGWQLVMHHAEKGEKCSPALIFFENIPPGGGGGGGGGGGRGALLPLLGVMHY